MLLFVPYQFDVPMYRYPVANFLFIGLIIAVSVANWTDGPFENLVLDGWSPVGMIGSVFLHGDIFHLVGNMIFLYVFGNIICSRLGNLRYILVVIALALIESSVHNIFAGGKAIGASGVINGVIGVGLVLFPINNVSCFWWVLYRVGTLELECRHLVVIWLFFDILGVVLGGQGVAYWAHLGGLAGGIGVGLLLLKRGWVDIAPEDQTIYDAFDIKGPPPTLTDDDDEEEDDDHAGRFKPPTNAQERARLSMLGAAGVRPANQPPPRPGAANATSNPPTAAVEKIIVGCRCGAKFRVVSTHVGKTARCPKCAQPLRIHASG